MTDADESRPVSYLEFRRFTEHVDRQLRKLGRGLTWRYAGLVLALLAAGASAWFTQGVSNRADRDVVDRIQHERHRFILDGCQDQNRRNRATKAEIARHRGSRPAAVAFENLLVDRLLPLRDCVAVADQQAPLQTVQGGRRS